MNLTLLSLLVIASTASAIETAWPFDGAGSATSPLTFGRSGAIYGYWPGGNDGSGNVAPYIYSETPVVSADLDQTFQFASLYEFPGQFPPFDLLGAGALVVDVGGNIYGTDETAGTIYKLAPGGAFTVLQSLGAYQAPQALALDQRRGVLYGAVNSATARILLLNTNGKVLLWMNPPSGYSNLGKPVLGMNGLVYDVALAGGANGVGGLLEFDPVKNTSTALYDFAADNQPVDDLALDPFSDLVGETAGGFCNNGQIYKFILPNRTFHAFYGFGESWNCGPKAPDISYPNAMLAIDSAGNVYGSSVLSVFKINLKGDFSTVYENAALNYAPWYVYEFLDGVYLSPDQTRIYAWRYWLGNEGDPSGASSLIGLHLP